MAWLRDNGFWALILVAFIGMHLFGHGGHGGHAGHGSGKTPRPIDGPDDGGAEANSTNTPSGGHRH